MSQDISQLEKMEVLIVGGGPAGLSTAIRLKALRPKTDVCVIEKGPSLGNHNLSGAVLEKHAISKLLDDIVPEWEKSDEAAEVLGNEIDKDDIMFLLSKHFSFNISVFMRLARKLHLGIGQPGSHQCIL